MIERIRKLGQEISEIKAANRVYWGRSRPTQAEKNLYERRRQRLQEIKNELPVPVQTFPFLSESPVLGQRKNCF